MQRTFFSTLHFKTSTLQKKRSKYKKNNTFEFHYHFTWIFLTFFWHLNFASCITRKCKKYRKTSERRENKAHKKISGNTVHGLSYDSIQSYTFYTLWELDNAKILNDFIQQNLEVLYEENINPNTLSTTVTITNVILPTNMDVHRWCSACRDILDRVKFFRNVQIHILANNYTKTNFEPPGIQFQM